MHNAVSEVQWFHSCESQGPVITMLIEDRAQDEDGHPLPIPIKPDSHDCGTCIIFLIVIIIDEMEVKS